MNQASRRPQGERFVYACLFAVTVGLATPPAYAHCPGFDSYQPYTIDELRDSELPLWDTWQVTYRGIPLTDRQVFELAGAETEIEGIRDDLERRGSWVYRGLAVAAGGTATSSVGWLLYGQDNVSQGVTLPMAIGGLLVGLVGVMVVTESIQRPLEPYLAPVPSHRLSREEMQTWVMRLNAHERAQLCDLFRISAEITNQYEGRPVRRMGKTPARFELGPTQRVGDGTEGSVPVEALDDETRR